MGTVKWFNSTKGYGFIEPDGGGKGVYLREDDKVSFDTVANRGKESAENLRVS